MTSAAEVRLKVNMGESLSRKSVSIPQTIASRGPGAEFERSIIRERQAEGIARAKARGVYKGRAKALSDEQLAQAQEWVDAGVPKAEVARRLGIGRTTLYSYLKSGRK